mmetsp:Transcript_38623/g.94605  ORF Transcript_38623/g.94605 Transcript_38623/m.94605 type:complete len:91 (-) Transcript_38623:107-379(-)
MAAADLVGAARVVVTDSPYAAMYALLVGKPHFYVDADGRIGGAREVGLRSSEGCDPAAVPGRAVADLEEAVRRSLEVLRPPGQQQPLEPA